MRFLSACLACLALSPLARADDWAPNVTTTGVWNSNVTNANRSSDQIDTLALKVDLLSSQHYDVSPSDTVHFGFHGGADWSPRYSLLTTLTGGLRGEWRHKFGTSTLAPTFSAEVAGDYVAAKETGRRGAATGITFSLRKRFNDATRGTLSYEIARQDARFSVYDRLGREVSLDLDRDLSERVRLTFGARFRTGDIVSYAEAPRPDLASIAPDRLAVETFDRPMTAYSIDAHTWTGRAALVRAVDENSAVILAYEYRDTSRSPLRYVNHLLSVAFVHQF